VVQFLDTNVIFPRVFSVGGGGGRLHWLQIVLHVHNTSVTQWAFLMRRGQVMLLRAAAATNETKIS
jgi:hypothetical protein